MNWHALRAEWPLLVGRLAALMVVAWSPFPGGPRVPSAVLALLGLRLLWQRRGALLERRPMARWCTLFALLWVPVALSLITSEDMTSTLKVGATLPAYLLAGIGLLGVLEHPRSAAWLERWIVVVLLVWVADSALQWLSGSDLLGVPLTADGRVVGLFGHNLRQATILAVLGPLVLARMAAWRWYLALLAYAGVFAIIVLSGVRGAWVMALVAAAIMLFAERRRVNWIAVGATAVVLAALVARSPLVEHKLAQTRLPQQWSFAEVDRLLSFRLTIWESALAMVADRPLTGVGAGAFDKAYPRFAYRANDPFRPGEASFTLPVYHAHQMYVSVAAESGLLGLGALLAMVGLLVRWYLGADPGRRQAALAPMAGLAGVAFPLNSQPILFTNWWLPILVLATCLLLASLDQQRSLPAA